MKPILIEFVPIILLAFAWFAIKNMDKKPGKDGTVARFIARIQWEAWILTIIVAVALAAIITKAAL